MAAKTSDRLVRAFLLLTLLTGAGRAAKVQASPPLDLMGDAIGRGASQARTIPGGSGAAYFNPALLAEVPGSFTMGFSVLNQRYGVQLDGRPGTEFAIPDGLANAGHADGKRFDNYAIPTAWLQFGRMKEGNKGAFIARPRQGAGSGHETLTYEVVGITVKLGERIGLGMHAMVPNGQFTVMRAFFNDEREQYFSNSLHPELYADRMTALSMALGLGVKVTEAFSLGVGATFALKASVVSPAYVLDASNLSKILLDMNASVNIGIAPHFGLSYSLGKRVRLTATAHTPQRVEMGASFTFLLPNGIEQASGLKFVLGYTPWQVGAGGSVDVIQDENQTLTLAATFVYATWSSYIDRHGELPSAAYAWSNTLSPTLGARYRLGAFTGLLDLAYVPTPVPLQTGRTNYVDNDRVSGTLGGEQGFKLFGVDMKLGAQVQVQRLTPRYQRKLPTPTTPDGVNAAPELVKDEVPDDAQVSGEPVASAGGLQTNNPGWPGFASGGWLLGGTVYFSIAL